MILGLFNTGLCYLIQMTAQKKLAAYQGFADSQLRIPVWGGVLRICRVRPVFFAACHRWQHYDAFHFAGGNQFVPLPEKTNRRPAQIVARQTSIEKQKRGPLEGPALLFFFQGRIGRVFRIHLWVDGQCLLELLLKTARWPAQATGFAPRLPAQTSTRKTAGSMLPARRFQKSHPPAAGWSRLCRTGPTPRPTSRS